MYGNQGPQAYDEQGYNAAEFFETSAYNYQVVSGASLAVAIARHSDCSMHSTGRLWLVFALCSSRVASGVGCLHCQGHIRVFLLADVCILPTDLLQRTVDARQCGAVYAERLSEACPSPALALLMSTPLYSPNSHAGIDIQALDIIDQVSLITT